VLSNLLDHAIQSTPEPGTVEVIVDNGAGIPLDDQSKIFQRHYRGIALSRKVQFPEPD